MLSVWTKEIDPMRDSLWTPIYRSMEDACQPRQGASRQERQHDRTLGLAYDVNETADHFELIFDVPGVAREDLNVELNNSQLVVTAERKGVRQARYQRVLTLPDGIQADAIEAKSKDGVLYLTVRKPVVLKPVKIRVNGETAEKPAGFFKNLISDMQQPVAAPN